MSHSKRRIGSAAGTGLGAAGLFAAARNPLVQCGAGLGNADLSQASLANADLDHADLHNANLEHADLRHTNLVGTDLSHARFDQTQLAESIYDDSTIFPEPLRTHLDRRSTAVGKGIRKIPRGYVATKVATN